MPELSIESKHNDQLTDCSIMLYVMTVRYPSARKYRDVFEDIKASVKELIKKSTGQDQSSKHVASLDNDMREKVRNLESGFVTGGAREEFTWMIGELTSGRSGLVESSLACENADADGTSQSQVAGNHPRDEPMLFPGDEIGEGNAVGSGFAATLYEYGNLGNDWSVPMVDGNGLAADGANFSNWSTAEKL
jgi:hypothetical protein